ncbi:hypothetical protein [Natrinema hispanicum]|uniref:Uncharacterized protein n=1 Tax=Natrinema hispanicum TaxID=392421 RepID=A0A1G6SLG0_9EURY|nr:hypothetical protein [Natrinema hispanicum]SDD17471.1 hypothetical protein SAMN05192552_101464 [Natrinema hispanicum]
MAVERANLPVVTKRGENGELVRVLIHENWFDKLSPLFSAFRWVRAYVAVESIPQELVQALQKPLELISSFVVDFGAFGWTFSLSLILLMEWAASKGVAVGKFVYEEVSGYGRARYGEGRYGKPIQVVKEIAE